MWNVLKRSYLALDMTSENMFKIKSKCCARRAARQLASWSESCCCFKHISVPASASCVSGPHNPAFSLVWLLPAPPLEGHTVPLVCNLVQLP